ncbi:MAG TPA: UxaA family hydrolase [Anaerovoracaceae bacterium]|nr:UxaA family hydrolase [Anaerovoracaceae bacterium]
MDFQDRKTALVIDKKDNVAVALTDLEAGDTCTVVGNDGKEYELAVTEKVPFGHKILLADLRRGDAVIKYGEEIGEMLRPLGKGRWIHNHNMSCEKGL